MAAVATLGAEVEGAPPVGSSRKEEKEAAASGELRHRRSRQRDGEEGWRWRQTTKVKWGGAAVGEGREEGGREGEGEREGREGTGCAALPLAVTDGGGGGGARWRNWGP
jgi:hypothetical protein